MSKSILIDNGTYSIRTGMTGDTKPSIYPSVIRNSTTNCYVGYEATDMKRFGIKSKYPLNNIFSKGKIVDFQNYLSFLDKNFKNELRVKPEEHSLVLTETTGTSSEERQKLTQIVFETFGILNFFIANDNLATLHASGETNGIVVNVGEDHSSCTPIINGKIISKGIILGSIAGKQISDHLDELLLKKEITTSNPQDTRKPLLYDIKEKTCEISIDFEKESKNVSSKDFELPDGNIITLEKERILAPEILFQPNIFNSDELSIDQQILSSLNKSSSDFDKDSVANVIISGGTTMFNGFPERLKNEISKNNSSIFNLNVIEPFDRKISSWVGISIISSLDSFEKSAMSKSEYEEFGSKYINIKCQPSFIENFK